MRAAVLAGLLMAMATGAEAKPPAVTDAPFHLRLPDRFATYAADAGQSDAPTFNRRNAPTSLPSGLSFGPIHAETVSDPRPGRHKAVMQYRLEGVQVLGGAVGGNVSGRGAVLTLHWPSGQ